jgi:tetratricopeptide (TPR) repeat protein
VPKDVAEAERLWQIGIDRGVWQAKNALAYIWGDEARNLDAALKLADEALADQPEDADVHDTHAWILFRLGPIDEAAAELERALEQEPYDPALIHHHLGEVYAARGEQDKARVQWEAALKADPDEELADKVRKRLDGNAP